MRKIRVVITDKVKMTISEEREPERKAEAVNSGI
jgi:hypothetical protein